MSCGVHRFMSEGWSATFCAKVGSQAGEGRRGKQGASRARRRAAHEWRLQMTVWCCLSRSEEHVQIAAGVHDNVAHGGELVQNVVEVLVLLVGEAGAAHSEEHVQIAAEVHDNVAHGGELVQIAVEVLVLLVGEAGAAYSEEHVQIAAEVHDNVAHGGELVQIVVEVLVLLVGEADVAGRRAARWEGACAGRCGG